MDTVAINKLVDHCKQHSIDISVYTLDTDPGFVRISGRNKDLTQTLRRVSDIEILEAQNTLSPDPVLGAIREVFEELTSKPDPS